jgi:hypothetical protein
MTLPYHAESTSTALIHHWHDSIGSTLHPHHAEELRCRVLNHACNASAVAIAAYQAIETNTPHY